MQTINTLTYNLLKAALESSILYMYQTTPYSGRCIDTDASFQKGRKQSAGSIYCYYYIEQPLGHTHSLLDKSNNTAHPRVT